MADLFDKLIGPVLKVEGGYVNHPSDRGGETNWGITVAVARGNGYTGPMKDMPKEVAVRIYRAIYWERPHLNRVAEISEAIAAEMLDTGINAGTKRPVEFLQKALNGLNRRARDYPDILADGAYGNKTDEAFRAYMKKNGKKAEERMLKLLGCQQGAFYLSITQSREKNEDFLNGWIDNRIGLKPSTKVATL